jgi:hypothetical protein
MARGFCSDACETASKVAERLGAVEKTQQWAQFGASTVAYWSTTTMPSVTISATSTQAVVKTSGSRTFLSTAAGLVKWW